MRNVEPWVAPLLPAESAWTVTLPAEPAAAGAMDVDRVYVPLKEPVRQPEDLEILEARSLTVPTTPPGSYDATAADRPVVVQSRRLELPSASLTALDRETGTRVWSVALSTAWPPVVGDGVVYVAVEKTIRALDAASGRELWSAALPSELRAPMLLARNYLLALTAPDELLGLATDARAIAWRRPTGETGAVRIVADHDAVYASTAGGRLMRIALMDGSVRWNRAIYRGVLGEPAVARDRVLVGTVEPVEPGLGSRAFYAVDPESGDIEWSYDYRHLGGHPVGAAAEGEVIYMAALDNVIRAFNRGSGNQKWKKELGTRPRYPPVAFGNIVVVTGISPTLTAFNTRTQASLGTWSAPPNTELQGPPLIDPVLRPFKTSIVVVLRDGQVIALRPTAMLFKEPAATPLSTLPGRMLLLEPFPGR